jgi:hypothetical protein
MLLRSLKSSHQASIFLFAAALVGVLAFPALSKTKIEPDKCGVMKQLTEPSIKAPFAPASSLCINGSLAVSDSDYQRVASSPSGTGVDGFPGCNLSGSGTSVNYDFYNIDLTGCAVFPTEVTATLCGPAGCQHTGNVDTVLSLYRIVPSGDALTANGGLPGAFVAANACANIRALQDDLGIIAGAANNPGGSTCNQIFVTNCIAPCNSPSSAGGLSGMRRQIGSGRFTLVVAGFDNSTVGAYNLYLDAPASGCQLALAPTAASAIIGGQVRTRDGIGIAKTIVTLSGSGISPLRAITNGFGYYNFGEVPVGASYVVTVASKQYTFNPSTRVITLENNITDADFVSEQ